MSLGAGLLLQPVPFIRSNLASVTRTRCNILVSAGIRITYSGRVVKIFTYYYYYYYKIIHEVQVQKNQLAAQQQKQNISLQKHSKTGIRAINKNLKSNKKIYPVHTAEIHALIPLILRYTVGTKYFIIIITLIKCKCNKLAKFDTTMDLIDPSCLSTTSD